MRNRARRRAQLQQIRDMSRGLSGALAVDVRKKPGGPIMHGAIATGLRGTNSLVIGNPAYAVAEQIRNALDPVKAPSKGRSFADMTEAERDEMRRLYARSKS